MRNALQQPPPDDSTDPLLALRGVGKRMWTSVGGADAYIDKLRDEDVPPGGDTEPDDMRGRCDGAWERVAARQGEVFRTARGLPVTHELAGDGIWFFRNGARINRMLTRKQFDVGVRRCPLRVTTDISDLIDYPYLFALLTDARISAGEW